MTDNEARLLTQVADMTEEMDRLRRKLAVAEQTNKNLRYCGNCRMVCPYICRSRGYFYDTWVYDRKRAFVGEDRK